jgi:carboxyl-terminal processing protease
MMYSYRPAGQEGPGAQLPEMNRKSSILFFSFLGVIGIAFLLNSFSPFSSGDPDPRKESVLVRSVVEGLSRLHYQPVKIDDEFSENVFASYLKDLDSGKRFFTKDDVAQLKQYERALDDQALAGTFECFNLSLELMDKALDKTEVWYKDILAKPMDFSANEKLQADGKKVEWAANDAELRNRWENWLKYDILSRISDEQEKQEKEGFEGEKKSFETLEAESREEVLKVYDRLFKRLRKLDRSKRLEIYLNAITNVFDPHTAYLSPQDKAEFDFQISGKLEGIGARLMSDGENTTVTEVVPGGPADLQGELQAEDIIVKVGQGDEKEDLEISGWTIDDVVAKIRGKKGTQVRLTVKKPDGTSKMITITRDIVIMEEGLAKSLLLRSEQTEPPVGYIYLPKFYADFTPKGVTSCAADVAKEIEKLKKEKVSGIILDLRNNGGGSLRDVVQMSGLFIENGPIVQVKSRTRNPEIMEDYDNRVQWAGPLVVMVNGLSASASEILAAAMQDYDRAVIVGSAGTYGKGTVQRFLDLDNATGDDSVKPLGNMKLTVQKFYRVNGETTQLQGVTPDIVLPDSYNLLDLGERENDFPLQASTINPVPYSQKVYHIVNMDELKANSASRVKANPTFRLVEENAVRLRKQKDQTEFPLQLEKYQTWEKKRAEEAKRYEDMFAAIDGFDVENLAVDLPEIKQDTSRAARNEKWVGDRKKDVQLYETYHIIRDMIRMDGLAGKQ